MMIVNCKDNSVDFSFCKGLFEKFGERRFNRGEYFARSGDAMGYVGWIVSGGFKYSLTSSDGSKRVIGFSLEDSILTDYEGVMHSTEMRTDIIVLEESVMQTEGIQSLILPRIRWRVGPLLRQRTPLRLLSIRRMVRISPS